jgi:hypothetical protein
MMPEQGFQLLEITIIASENRFCFAMTGMSNGRSRVDQGRVGH